MKIHAFSAGEVLFVPLCACALAAAGCTTQVEVPMPNGAYVAEQPQAKEPLPPAPAKKSTPAPAQTQVEEEIFIELNPLEPADDPVAPQPQAEPAKKAAAKPAVKQTAKTAGQEIVYKIKKGDTLSAIAAKHKMTATALAGYNDIQTSKILRIGETIRIPVAAGSEAAAIEESKPAAKDVKSAGTKETKKTAEGAAAASAAAAGGTAYIVKPGDTLSGIAWRHSVKMSQIAELNKIDPKAKLLAGRKLILPKEAKLREAKASTAKKTDVKPAVKTETKAAAKTESKSVKASPEKIVKPSEKPAASAAKTSSADDIINAIGEESSTEPAKKAEQNAPASAKSPVPAESSSLAIPPQDFDTDDSNLISVPVPKEMTLEEASRVFERKYEDLKKMNPGIQETQKLKAGTQIKIPIY